MLLLSLAVCTGLYSQAQTPLYWGETVCNLEQVPFGMDVNLFHSKAKTYDQSDINEMHPTRYYSKDKAEYVNPDGEKTFIYCYETTETNFSEVLARFGNYEFPFTSMIADPEDKLVGILATARLNEPDEVDRFIAALAGKYGTTCTVGPQSFGRRNYEWTVGKQTVQLCIQEPDPERQDAVIQFEEDETGHRTITGGGSRPHTWYEISLFVTLSDYNAAIGNISSGEWTCFWDSTDDNRATTIHLQDPQYDTGPLVTEDDLVPDHLQACMVLPNGHLPRFKEGPLAEMSDFRQAIHRWMSSTLTNQTDPPLEGTLKIIFTIDRKGRATDTVIEQGNWMSAGQRESVIQVFKKLPAIEPAVQNGQPVSFRMALILMFVAN